MQRLFRAINPLLKLGAVQSSASWSLCGGISEVSLMWAIVHMAEPGHRVIGSERLRHRVEDEVAPTFAIRE